MEIAIEVVLVCSGILFAAAAVMSIVRIVRGPSIVDRVVGSDTLATIVMCALIADMTVRDDTSMLPLVLGLALGASIGTMAVARFVSRSRSSVTPQTAEVDSEPDWVRPQTGEIQQLSPEAALAEDGMRDQGDFSDIEAAGHDAVSGIDVDGARTHPEGPHPLAPDAVDAHDRRPGARGDRGGEQYRGEEQ